MRVSSGLVRTALAAGDMARAAQLLGRPYSMRARVRRGARLGRTLGISDRQSADAPAAHAARGHLRGARARRALPRAAARARAGWPAVASLGTRPTVNGVEPLLEVHLFDYQGELYGRGARSRVRGAAAR